MIGMYGVNVKNTNCWLVGGDLNQLSMVSMVLPLLIAVSKDYIFPSSSPKTVALYEYRLVSLSCQQAAGDPCFRQSLERNCTGSGNCSHTSGK